MVVGSSPTCGAKQRYPLCGVFLFFAVQEERSSGRGRETSGFPVLEEARRASRNRGCFGRSEATTGASPTCGALLNTDYPV